MSEIGVRSRRSVACAVLVCAVAWLCIPDRARASTDFADYVDPLVGTSGNGYDGGSDTFPAADAPFGMMQWGPDTPSQPSGGGYSYNDSTITGFSLTHLSGPGCNVFGDVGILPTIGAVTDPAHAAQAFSHASEVASPGYYEVIAGMPGIRAQLAVATRAGVGAFTFPPSPAANLLINASSNQAGVSAMDVRVVGNDELAGSVESGFFCGMPGEYTVYFTLHFDRPFIAHGAWLGKHVLPGADSASGAGGGSWVTFDTTADPTVRVKAALSWVSLAGAEANARADARTWDVQKLRAATARAWSSELARVRVDGGTLTQRRVFYTALYHAMLHPNVYSDADGSYRGFDGQVHRTDLGHVEYATFSGWDIYRTQIPLLALLEPTRTSDMMRSLVHAAAQSGWLPKWSLVNVETAVMGGDPSDPMLAAAYAFGARDFDARAALRAMVKGASQTTGPPGQGWYFQRPGLEEYLARGYVINAHTTNVAPLANGASLTLEYALDDFSIAQLAAALGDRRTYEQMLARSQNWSNLFDRSTGLIAPRDADGAFVQTPLTDNGQSGFQEGTAAQYTWMIPYDLRDLFAGMGGRDKASSALDLFFLQIDAGQDKPYAWMGNEPSVGSPWAYLSAGTPWKAQRVIRDVMTQLWGDTPDGIPGNDDLGTMSAWYVWSALGLYPQYPAVAVLDLGAPLFPHASIRVPGRPPIDIDAAQASADNAFVQSLRVDGKPSQKSWVWLPSSRPMRLSFTLGLAPNTHWASAAEDAPPSFAAQPLRFPPSTMTSITAPNPAQIALAPGAAASLQFSVANAAAAPESVSWHVDVPGGLTIAPPSGRVETPASAGRVVEARIAAGAQTPDGLYDVYISGQTDSGALLSRAAAYVRVVRAGNGLPLLYAASPFDDAITPVDPRTYAVGAPIVVGQFPRFIATSPDGKRAYVTDNASNEVSVVDTAPQAVFATVAVGRGPWGIAAAPNGSTIWIANNSDNTVQSIDTATLQPGKPIPVGRLPETIAISPNGAMLWVADEGSNDVTPVDVPAGVALDPIPVGARPRGIAVSPDGKTVYVANYASDSVTPIDAASRTAGPPIAVGKAPRGIAVSPDGKWVYVTNYGAGTVTPIDRATRVPGPPIVTGLNPVAVVFGAGGATAFVVNAGDNDCVPIDVASGRVGDRIPLGDRPMGIAR